MRSLTVLTVFPSQKTCFIDVKIFEADSFLLRVKKSRRRLVHDTTSNAAPRPMKESEKSLSTPPVPPSSPRRAATRAGNAGAAVVSCKLSPQPHHKSPFPFSCLQACFEQLALADRSDRNKTSTSTCFLIERPLCLSTVATWYKGR